MSLVNYFNRLSSWSVKQVEDFLKNHDPEDYNLIDVRQPVEYEEGHLPGAVIIPVGELEAAAHQFDPQKPTVVYCASGMRSRAAAAILSHAGFKETHNMEGGMNAWKGGMAEGMPGEAMIFFSSAKTSAEYIVLSLRLEEGARKFYQGLKEIAKEPSAVELFDRLVVAEDHHISTLAALYDKVSEKGAGPFVVETETEETGDIMEGGMRVEEGLSWAEGREIWSILELSIFLEATAYDRYLYMKKNLKDEQARDIFTIISNEEKRHLEALTELFEKLVASDA